ncbi:DUF6907 domain-containing protein [Pseudonocardia hispaniensis]|uniref:DUF6907 domain-containing protein n=1 Tax=Pseudonocardia hispaniensis TaxID=904933 RepID=A0ABW1J620_9PSEU
MNSVQHDPTPPVCPPWCATHQVTVDPVDGTRFVTHRALVTAAAGRRLDIEQTVTIHPDSRVQTSPALVVVDGRPDDALTVDEAREFSAALSAAATLVAGGAR